MIGYNQAFPFWDELEELQQSEVLDNTVIREYVSGAILEKRAGLYMVNDGSIIVYSSHENGRRRAAFSAHWLECMLLTPKFLSDEGAAYLEIVARESSEICFIPYDAWFLLEEQIPKLREFSVDILSRQMGSLAFVIYARLEQIISKRIALFLLRTFEKEKEEFGNTLRMSHEALADQVGTTREVVTRNVSVLKKLGLVETGREKIRILDPEKLREYVNQVTEDGREE